MIEIGMNHIVKNFGFKKILDKACLEVMTGERAATVSYTHLTLPTKA